jgi:hypothetical protein
MHLAQVIMHFFKKKINYSTVSIFIMVSARQNYT